LQFTPSCRIEIPDENLLKVGSKITWHFVCKMFSLYGTFADRLCQVIFVRSLKMEEWVEGMLLSSTLLVDKVPLFIESMFDSS